MLSDVEIFPGVSDAPHPPEHRPAVAVYELLYLSVLRPPPFHIEQTFVEDSGLDGGIIGGQEPSDGRVESVQQRHTSLVG